MALFQLKHLLLGKAKDKKCFLISWLANARRGLASIQCLQERDSNSIYLENNLRKLRDEIFLMQSKIAYFKYSPFFAKCSQKGDKMSKLFFDVVTPKPRKFQMGALKRNDGTLSTNPDEMREIASRYYEQLLSSDEVSQNVLAMRGIVS